MTKLNDFQRLENVIIYINRIGYYTENLSEGRPEDETGSRKTLTSADTGKD